MSISRMRQSTRRICRYCFKESEEYGVIEGEPITADLARGHNPHINRDMDAHQKVCEQNPNRHVPLWQKVWDWFDPRVKS